MFSPNDQFIIDVALTVLILTYTLYLWRAHTTQSPTLKKLKKYTTNPSMHNFYEKIFSRDFLKTLALLTIANTIRVLTDLAAMGVQTSLPIWAMLGSLFLQISLFLIAITIGYRLFNKSPKLKK